MSLSVMGILFFLHCMYVHGPAGLHAMAGVVAGKPTMYKVPEKAFIVHTSTVDGSVPCLKVEYMVV